MSNETYERLQILNYRTAIIQIFNGAIAPLNYL